MSKTVFSSELFEQMGGVNWLTRPGDFEFFPESSDLVQVSANAVVDSLPAEPIGNEGSTLRDALSESVEVNVLSQTVKTASSAESISPPIPEVIKEAVNHPVQTLIPNTLPTKPLESHGSAPLNNLPNIVVLGAGLDAVWQNEDTQAWQLWQNIMLAFDWDESQMVFFDTTHLVSDEMVFTTMEEVIDLGVDWVLTMDETHPISEQLVEGVHVVSVPDLESMLSDPYAKQSFYHAVIELNV